MSPLDILYIVLAFFTTAIGTLLIIALMRVIKILGVVQEITDYYYKIKSIFSTYAKIPDTIKEKAKETLKKNK